MKQKIIVDTSIWIEYFRNNADIVEKVNKGLDRNEMCIVGPVVTELMQGIKSDKELTLLSNYIGAIPFLNCELKDWTDAGLISLSLRKTGNTIPLIDLIISAIAINNDAMIYTKDKHFNLIPDVRLFHSH